MQSNTSASRGKKILYHFDSTVSSDFLLVARIYILCISILYEWHGRIELKNIVLGNVGNYRFEIIVHLSFSFHSSPVCFCSSSYFFPLMAHLFEFTRFFFCTRDGWFVSFWISSFAILRLFVNFVNVLSLSLSRVYFPSVICPHFIRTNEM